MNPTVPTVSARGVLATTRALYVLLGATLVPLLAQHLFGPRVEPAVIGLFVVASALVSIALARGAVSERPSLRLIPLGALGGLVAGVGVSLAWVASYRANAQDAFVAAPLFGAIYGTGVGAAMGALLAGWSHRARAALATPSAVSAHKLTIEAGLALALAGAAGYVLHRAEGMQVASLALGFTGTVAIVIGTVRAVRLSRLFTEIGRPDGGYQVVQRTASTHAPAVAWVAPLDHVVVRTEAGSQVEPGAFRANSPAAEVAVVPRDLSLVHRAIGRAVAFGFAALGGTMLLYGAVTLFGLVTCCGSAPCSGCAH
jgi:hypothetical protein